MKCLLCDIEYENLKRFSDHIKSAHKLSSAEYTIKFLCGGVKPVCSQCGEEVRYTSFSFKSYCKEHSKVAMKLGGQRGGAAIAWNRGLTKENDPRIAESAIKVSGSNNHFFGRHHSAESLQKISISKTLSNKTLEERLLERADEFVLVTPIEEYYSRQRQYLVLRCISCGEEQKKTLQAFERGSRCYKCFPIGKSNWELQVYEFTKSHSADTVSGDKSVLNQKEIDVFVPSKKFGIECHGLYWHSDRDEEENFDKRRHLRKFELSQERGINLLQLFEDEWRDKREICESMIKHRLGVNNIRCHTRSTRVVELTVAEERNFFNSTHISGYTKSKICWGLKDKDNNIVAALSIRIPRHKKKYTNSIELARFSLQLETSAPGALSKLLKVLKIWCKSANISKIMTYVDRRVGYGKGYLAAGFRLVGSTPPDYWYTDNRYRYDRFKFRARDGQSEKCIAEEARVSQIWGCGSNIFILDV